MADTGIIYLCRHGEGISPIRSFLASISEFSAGVAYDLHVIFKGFPNAAALEKTKAIFEGHPFNSIELDDSGFDIGSYTRAARLVSNRRLMFLNTFSVILAANWLLHFVEALDQSGVGVAGATGSWQARVTGYEARVWSILHRLASSGSQHAPASLLPRRSSRLLGVLRVAVSPVSYLYYVHQYPRYPNPHIRTNAFLIDRSLFLSLEFPNFDKKESAYRFESGRWSMTNQIIARGLRPVIVGRNGTVFDVKDWYASSIFWAGLQENLLVSDNRTRDYASGDLKSKLLLENMAWRHPRSWHHV